LYYSRKSEHNETFTKFVHQPTIESLRRLLWAQTSYYYKRTEGMQAVCGPQMWYG